MPRANRYFLPGHVWHITHRRRERAFLLKFARDRAVYLRWLFEARKRYGICVLNYLVYVDLNMVRAGAVSHPAEWEHGGYREIQSPRNRYRVIDLGELGALCGFSELAAFQEEYRNWVGMALREGGSKQDETWTRSVAVGSEHYIAGVREGLGLRASHREMAESGEGHVLREPQPPYRLESVMGNAALRPENTFPWDHLHESTTA
ncbi:MAG: hypothetical protein ACKVQA_01860 [Burkholderiales bacterium]